MLASSMGDLQRLPAATIPSLARPEASATTELHRGNRGIRIRPADMPMAPRNPPLPSAAVTTNGQALTKSEAALFGPHRTDRDLLVIVRAVLAENPYQFAKVDRGPVWKQVMKRLQKEGLNTNIKVVRQRLRRNLRAHRERKRSSKYNPTTSMEMEKDALLDQLESIVKQGVYGQRSCYSRKSPVSYSMAPSHGLMGNERSNVDWQGNLQADGMAATHQEQADRNSTGKNAPPRKGLKMIIQSTNSTYTTKIQSTPKSTGAATFSSAPPNKKPTISFTGGTQQKLYTTATDERISDLNDTGSNRRVLTPVAVPLIEYDNDLGDDIADDEYYGHAHLDSGAHERSINGSHSLALNEDDFGLSSEENESKITSPRQKLADVAYQDLDEDLDYSDGHHGLDAFGNGELHCEHAGSSSFPHFINSNSSPYLRRGYGDPVSSASISEDERTGINVLDDISTRPLPSNNKRDTELQKLELWKEEINLAKQRFTEEQMRRKLEIDIMLARDKFEREMAVQRLAFETEQRDKDREAEYKRHELQLKCHAEMQELQIRAQQEQNKLMLEIVKLLRPHNDHA
ncbi:uncharacterized protein LOC129595045 [Paramacrobiotus metropolitanus]|uniref:uncharacterized protein LOC129595045 n=1 Tax=Paramacrobiotus metropolitanus TaxID=2943436 RepID=UPI002446082B|nr:uncharacterized protein LOC129595045 [Paramacrobiotus metropolitanus]